MSDSFSTLDDEVDDYYDDGAEYDDEWDYEPDPMEGYEPDPTDHPDFERHEYERYLRSLSPLGRIRYRVSSLIWRYTWRWRIKPGTPGGDEPPF